MSSKPRRRTIKDVTRKDVDAFCSMWKDGAIIETIAIRLGMHEIDTEKMGLVLVKHGVIKRRKQ